MMQDPFVPIEPVELAAVIGGAKRVTSRDTSSDVTLQLSQLASQLQLATSNSTTSSSSLTMAMMMMVAMRR